MVRCEHSLCACLHVCVCVRVCMCVLTHSLTTITCRSLLLSMLPSEYSTVQRYLPASVYWTSKIVSFPMVASVMVWYLESSITRISCSLSSHEYPVTSSDDDDDPGVTVQVSSKTEPSLTCRLESKFTAGRGMGETSSLRADAQSKCQRLYS